MSWVCKCRLNRTIVSPAFVPSSLSTMPQEKGGEPAGEGYGCDWCSQVNTCGCTKSSWNLDQQPAVLEGGAEGGFPRIHGRGEWRGHPSSVTPGCTGAAPACLDSSLCLGLIWLSQYFQTHWASCVFIKVCWAFWDPLTNCAKCQVLFSLFSRCT